MKAYMLMTKSGPIVVLTSHASILDAFLLEKLADKGIEKFIAYEVPIGLAEQRYGAHFTVVRGDLRETDDLREPSCSKRNSLNARSPSSSSTRAAGPIPESGIALGVRSGPF
jgi:hypothetical protein